jgi:hypothetical protein
MIDGGLHQGTVCVNLDELSAVFFIALLFKGEIMLL